VYNIYVPVLLVCVCYITTLSVETLESVEDKMINKYATAGEIRIGRGNRNIRTKLAPEPLCSPQIPYYLTLDRIQVAEMGSRRLRT
jgi:hypothetical protein